MPMPNGTMNRMAVDLQRDLMRRQRGGADQAHQQRRRGKQAVFQQERDRDRRADDDQLPHQHPVDAPDPAQHVIFPERPAAMRKPEAGQKHAAIDDRGGEPGAEQFQPRQSPFAVDQQIDQHGIGRDRGQRDPQHRLRPVDRAHEAADREEPQRRRDAPRQTEQIFLRQMRGRRRLAQRQQDLLAVQRQQPSSAAKSAARPTARRAARAAPSADCARRTPAPPAAPPPTPAPCRR